jgi:hypothetical protein
MARIDESRNAFFFAPLMFFFLVAQAVDSNNCFGFDKTPTNG